MRAFSWMMGPDIVSALSLACYYSSIQQKLSLLFDVFFFANSLFFTFSNIFGSLSITRFYIQTVNCIQAFAFTAFIIPYFSLHDKRWLFVFFDITTSVKNIRNHVGTAALPAARRLQRLSSYTVPLNKYLATDLRSFTSPSLYRKILQNMASIMKSICTPSVKQQIPRISRSKCIQFDK